MSKIGKLPVKISDSIKITLEGQSITVNGAKGTLTHTFPKGIKVEQGEGELIVSQVKKDDIETRALFGLTRALVANMVEGVDKGFEKQLELVGVGYKANLQGADLVLSLGFAHPVKFNPPTGITFTVKDNVITVAGIDKSEVGNMAAKIRAVKPPEPYKGKGIKYIDEIVRRKAGKAAKAGE